MTVDQRLSTALADHYRIERELGQGGMATVISPKISSTTGRWRSRFSGRSSPQSSEPTVSCGKSRPPPALQHPHILGLIDSGEVNGTRVLHVMPFVEGRVAARPDHPREAAPAG